MVAFLDILFDKKFFVWRSEAKTLQERYQFFQKEIGERIQRMRPQQPFHQQLYLASGDPNYFIRATKFLAALTPDTFYSPFDITIDGK